MAATAVALLGGASTAAATDPVLPPGTPAPTGAYGAYGPCSDAEEEPPAADGDLAELADQLSCQFGDGNRNVTINQTNNISINGDLDGELDNSIFPPEWE